MVVVSALRVIGFEANALICCKEYCVSRKSIFEVISLMVKRKRVTLSTEPCDTPLKSLSGRRGEER